MKPEDYNPKAREAFGQSLINIGVALFKSIFLLITVLPISLIIKSAIEGEDTVTIIDALASMPNSMFYTLLGLIALAFVMGHFLRKEGLRHIHESENKNSEGIISEKP